MTRKLWVLILLAGLAGIAVVLAFLTRSAGPTVFVSPLHRQYLPLLYERLTPRRGVGAITQMDYSCEDLLVSGIGWMHDWSMHPKDCGIPVVCQAWGLGSELGEPDPRCGIVVLWNEPSIIGQANISPQVAAERWPIVEQQRAVWAREISTPCDTSMWLNAWANEFQAANGRWPVFDHVCIHSYPAAFSAQQAADETMAVVDGAKSWSLAHGGDGRAILHEFAVWPAWGEGIADEYMRQVVPRLDESGVMYAWFGLSRVGYYMTHGSEYERYYDTSLVRDGELSRLGEVYVGN